MWRATPNLRLKALTQVKMKVQGGLTQAHLIARYDFPYASQLLPDSTGYIDRQCVASLPIIIHSFVHLFIYNVITSFAVHYEKIRIHLRETATNSAKIHLLARKSEHLHINQIQLRFLHVNQHSITFLGIHLRHSTYKREKYTFINANIRVINIILKIIRDNRQTFKCKRYSLTFL